MTSSIAQLIQRYWEHLPDTYGSVEDITQTLIIREGDTFLLTDTNGNCAGGNITGLGLYHRDTRHLSAYDFLIDGFHPLVLLSSAESGYSQEQVLGNRHMVVDGRDVSRASIEVRRHRVAGYPFTERLTLTNYNSFPVPLRPAYIFGADFADIFEVRGHKRRAQGRLGDTVIGKRSVLYYYTGADGVERKTEVEFAEPPDVIEGRGVAWDLTLSPGEVKILELAVYCWHGQSRPAPKEADLPGEYAAWRSGFPGIHTDNTIFNQMLRRSIDDLRVLWTERADGSYFAAGLPWYSTLFGRDSLLTAFQLLPFRPEFAASCLRLLGSLQAVESDATRDAEPGKILHEFREDELSTVGELPYSLYYGSVDSTPLFVRLAAEYYRWTADLETLRDLLPAILRALRWIEGQIHDSGYVRHRTDSPAGLRNQGWKDSVEGIIHADGSLMSGPIALAEVQGYAFAALTEITPVLVALGEKSAADDCRRTANNLAERFSRDFWQPDLNLLATALDGDDRPARVWASNAGQVLWSGIIDRTVASEVKDAMFANQMFTGWGIRTLASDTPGYSPLGYHVGTVWPHDNGIIASGLKRYGFDHEAAEILTALSDAARHFPLGRLPELFGGQPRSIERPPIPYPVACRPQAWTAGSILQLLATTLGLYPDANRQRLNVIRPHLPPWLRQVQLRGIRVGNGRTDLKFLQAKGRTVCFVENAKGLRVERRSEPVSPAGSRRRS